jgi:hypothetical protein
MKASFFFSVYGLVTRLSCLCHPNVHLMGSSAPWRSELVISPCAPILWYLSTGMVLHIKSYALQGLISPRHHSNVNHISSLKLSNICITSLSNLLRAQRPYTDPLYKAKEIKGQPIGQIPTRKGKFPQRVIQTMYSDVLWF